jgi:hypothetical protein
MTSQSVADCADGKMSDEDGAPTSYGVWLGFPKNGEAVYKSTELSHFISMPFEEAKGEVGKIISVTIGTSKKLWEGVTVKQIEGMDNVVDKRAARAMKVLAFKVGRPMEIYNYCAS